MPFRWSPQNTHIHLVAESNTQVVLQVNPYMKPGRTTHLFPDPGNL